MYSKKINPVNEKETENEKIKNNEKDNDRDTKRRVEKASFNVFSKYRQKRKMEEKEKERQEKEKKEKEEREKNIRYDNDNEINEKINQEMNKVENIINKEKKIREESEQN